MEIIGREEEIHQLARSAAKVTLLVGDIGVGKSTVLATAQDRQEDCLAPRPVRLRASPGALQLGILEALGSSLSELASDETTAARVGAALMATVSSVAHTQLHGLAEAVGRHLLGTVRARVGDTAADALAEFIAKMSTPEAERLASRISSAGDADVVNVLVSFAQEVVSLANGRSLVLALDNVDELDEGDRRRLCDLVTSLPDGCLLRGAFATWNQTKRQDVDEIAAHGAEIVEIGGLSESSIRSWLQLRGLSEEFAAEVYRTTSGYALLVADALDLLDSGETDLASLTATNVLARRTKLSWAQLDPGSQASTAKLAVFRDPMPREEARDFLGMDEAEYATLERRLEEAGLFVGSPPWFHELRRRCIWRDLLTGAQDAIAADAAERIATTIRRGGEPIHFVQFAACVRESPSMLASNEQLSAALAADLDQIAVLASLIELVDRDDPALDGEHVALHARDMFGAKGDLPDALQKLEAVGLVAVASNDRITAVAPTFGDDYVYFLVLGRSASELGRLAMPGAASQLFQGFLRARLPGMTFAHYGIGHPSMSKLSQMGAELQGRPDEAGVVTIGRRGPNLLLRLWHGDLPLYAAVAFGDDAERDAATTKIATLPDSVWGLPLELADRFSQPAISVPSRRWLRAAERLIGQSLGRGTTTAGVKTDSPIAGDEAARRRAAALDLVRSRSSSLERLAYELELPTGYAFRVEDAQLELIKVHGRAGSVELPPRDSPFGAPFDRLRTAQTADLAPRDQIGRMTWLSGLRSTDPVVDELAELSTHAASFNKFQARRRILLQPAALAAALTEAMQLAADDATEMSAALDFGVPTLPVVGRAMFVVLTLSVPDERFIPAAFSTIVAVEIDSDDGLNQAHVHIASPGTGLPRTGNDPLADMSTIFDRDLSQVRRRTHADAYFFIAQELGHGESEITLAMP